MKKKVAMVLLMALLVGSVFANGNSEKQSTSSAEKKDKVGLIASVFGTQSFNDDVNDGLKLIAANLGLETVAIEGVEVTDVANSLRTLIMQDCTILVIPSADFADGMLEVAEEYPDVKFIYCDGLLDQSYDNILTMQYAENEGAFIMGALAGLLTKTNNVGAVLAIKGFAVMDRFQYGFTAGVKTVNPDCVVQVAYTNSFADPNKGNEVATAMYTKGADIVSCYAGACNLGVFNACSNAGDDKYCFGAAKGQFDQLPEKIVASLVKPIDKALFHIVDDYVTNGVFDSSTPVTLGLSNEGVVVKYTDLNDDLLKMVTSDIKSKLDMYAGQIGSGELKVPANEAEYNSYMK